MAGPTARATILVELDLELDLWERCKVRRQLVPSKGLVSLRLGWREIRWVERDSKDSVVENLPELGFSRFSLLLIGCNSRFVVLQACVELNKSRTASQPATSFDC